MGLTAATTGLAAAFLGAAFLAAGFLAPLATMFARVDREGWGRVLVQR